MMILYAANVTKNLSIAAIFHWFGLAAKKFTVDGTKILLGQKSRKQALSSI